MHWYLMIKFATMPPPKKRLTALGKQQVMLHLVLFLAMCPISSDKHLITTLKGQLTTFLFEKIGHTCLC